MSSRFFRCEYTVSERRPLVPNRSWLDRVLPAFRSVNALVCEAVTSSPKGTLRARSSFRVIRAFFMRTADNPVSHHGRAWRVSLEEGQNLLTDGGITAHVQVALGEPALEKIWLVIFSEDNAHDDLGGQLVVWSVEGNGSNGVAAKARAEFLAQPRLGRSLFVAESSPSLHREMIRRALPNSKIEFPSRF